MRGQLSHIEIYVSNLETSSAFWGWFLGELGYEAFQSWARGRSWRLGGTYFVIVQVEEAFRDNPYHRKNVGLNHLAFHAGSRGDVDAMLEKLRERKARILYAEKHPCPDEKSYAVFFEDPDKLKVEFVFAS